MLPSEMWMQKSKSDGSKFEMRIDLIKLHYNFQNHSSLILHFMIDYQSL